MRRVDRTKGDGARGGAHSRPARSAAPAARGALAAQPPCPPAAQTHASARGPPAPTMLHVSDPMQHFTPVGVRAPPTPARGPAPIFPGALVGLRRGGGLGGHGLVCDLAGTRCRWGAAAQAGRRRRGALGAGSRGQEDGGACAQGWAAASQRAGFRWPSAGGRCCTPGVGSESCPALPCPPLPGAQRPLGVAFLPRA